MDRTSLWNHKDVHGQVNVHGQVSVYVHGQVNVEERESRTENLEPCPRPNPFVRSYQN